MKRNLVVFAAVLALAGTAWAVDTYVGGRVGTLQPVGGRGSDGGAALINIDSSGNLQIGAVSGTLPDGGTALVNLDNDGNVRVAGITLQPSVRYEFTNCAAAGSTAQTVTGGPYVFRVAESDARLCIASSAAPDGGTVCGFSDGGLAGELFPSGTVMKLTVPGASRSISCSSASATGDVHFTSVAP